MNRHHQKQLRPSLPILLIDDDANALQLMTMNLRMAGFSNVVSFQSGTDALPWISQNPCAVAVLDIVMPGITGTDLLHELRKTHPEVPAVMVTGLNDIETAIHCIREGARDYIVKPVSPERLITSITNAVEFSELQRSYHRLSQAHFSNTLENPDAFAAIKTTSAQMMTLFRYCEAIARTEYPVLITGETGTGKELFARALHTASGMQGTFIAVNVAGLDDTSFSDVLFGHVKGAFTDAAMTRPGLVEAAAGGTLFLDEIGDLSLQSQVKLLRLLQEGEYMPLGTDTVRRSSCRILAATNQNLDTLTTSRGAFRADLYYRLKTHKISIPPLRERKEDIQILLEWFLESTSRELQCKKPSYPPELLQLLAAYAFPGNIRELRGMVREALLNHSRGILSTRVFQEAVGHKEDITLDNNIHEYEPSVTFHTTLPTLRELERSLVSEAYTRAGENQSVAASLIGITRQAFAYHLKKIKSVNADTTSRAPEKD